MFFIIFGTRGITSTKEQGQFHCPSCGPNSNYRLKSVRRFFTLYFIPIIPLDTLGQYVECGHCQGTFDQDVFQYKPAENQGLQLQMMFKIAMKQVMIGMLLADGVINDKQVAEIQKVFEELADVEVTERDLREEIAVIQRENSPSLELMASIASSLNDSGKEKVVRAAYRIAMADNVFADAESEFLSDLSAALDIGQDQLRRVMSELMN